MVKGEEEDEEEEKVKAEWSELSRIRYFSAVGAGGGRRKRRRWNKEVEGRERWETKGAN